MTNDHRTLDAALSGFNAWVGRKCTEISHREYDWVFSFEDAGGVTCACPWRIISDHHIALANIDDGQLFGLEKPVDGAVRAKEIVDGKRVLSVKIAPISGDLAVSFEDETTLELFNHSAGYEGWQAIANSGHEGIYVVAMGGGTLAIWKQ